ncbi:MAG: polysaccharide biosynthesis C-terminal domain-containing protein, partial [Hydrogenophaga sp.]
LIALPVATCIYILAPFLIPVLLGNKWLAAVPLMQLLAFNGALLLFHASICAVLIARGHPARVMYANLGYTILLLGLLGTIFFFYKDIGVVGAAYAALLTSLISTPLYLYQLHRCLGLRPSLFLRSISRPVLACTAIALLVPALLPAHQSSMGVLECLQWLVAGGAIAVFVYALAILAAWALAGRPDGAERIVLRQARGVLHHFKILPSRGHS